VQEVKNKLVVRSSSQHPSPVKQSKNQLNKEVSFNNSNDHNPNASKHNSKNTHFQHSPIEYQGNLSIADKVAAGASASRSSNDGSVSSSLSGAGGKKEKQQYTNTNTNNSNSKSNGNNSNSNNDTTGNNSTPLEVKVDVLKKQLKKKCDDVKKYDDKMKRMEKEMENMHNQWQDAEDALTTATKKINKSNKAKLTAQKKVTEMTQEMSHYESLIQAVEQLRENEALLLQKVNHLEDQNIETSKALKASMSRELEWRSVLS
jgi:hypothetical protein